MKKKPMFANPLWGVNFMMYSMSQGVSRVSLVQRPEAKRSLWIPIPNDKVPGILVQGPYYALPFIADFIGKTAQGPRGVMIIDLGSHLLSAYAMLDGDKLALISMVNLREYAGGAQRNAVKIELRRLANIQNIDSRRLHADAGTAAGGFDVNGKNITWSGEQLNYKVNLGKAHGEGTRKTKPAENGVVDVVIPDSHCVLEIGHGKVVKMGT